MLPGCQRDICAAQGHKDRPGHVSETLVHQASAFDKRISTLTQKAVEVAATHIVRRANEVIAKTLDTQILAMQYLAGGGDLGQMKTAAETPKRSANALACRTLICRRPFSTSLTTDCAPSSVVRSACFRPC